MNLSWISEKLSIAPQPTLDDFIHAKAGGFGAIIYNRPDGEELEQPGRRYLKLPFDAFPGAVW